MEKFREYIFKKKLDVIVDYIDRHRDNQDFHVPYDFHMVKQKGEDELFGIITNLFGFNKLPKVAKSEFDVSKFKVMYRGAPKKTYHANLLLDTEDRYYGTGDHGHGVYGTDDRAISKYYARGNEGEGDELAFYLIGAQVGTEKFIRRVSDYLKGKTQDYRSVYDFTYNFENGQKEPLDSQYTANRIKWLDEYIKQIQDPELKQLFLNVICRDFGKMGILLGYDAFVVYDGSAGNVVVLNRNKITVTQSEYNRIYDAEERVKRREIKKVRLFKPEKQKLLEKGA